MNKQQAKDFLLVFVGLTASGVLLTLIQPPFGLSFLAWVAYVPFILVAVSYKKFWPNAFIISYLIALAYWLGNIYWMSFVTVSGWLAFCAWTALLWPVLIITLRYCKEKKIPLMIAAAVLIVGIEKLQGFLLGGFYWRHLSHSQYANITLIQIADIFGAASLSFLIAMVNGLIAELIITAMNSEFRIQNSEKKVRLSPWVYLLNSKFSILIVAAAIAGVLIYGKWRIRQSETTIKTGPMVGVVQSNLPQSVKSSDDFEVTRGVFAGLLELSKNCSAAGAELVIWPETIVPVIMDKAFWPFLYEPNENVYFHKALGEHASHGVYVLVGAPGGEIIFENEYEVTFKKYNSAFLYEPDGDQAIVKYNKIHLVPFGEIVPFKQIAPWLYKFLMMFSPYDFDYNLTPGNEYTVFEIKTDESSLNNDYRFGVIICYEGAVPYIARRFALGASGGKGVDWLVNISNDGWFVRFKGGETLASTELAQHTISCVFRAVENRISVLRSVNTGISCLIDPVGRIKDGYSAGNLPEKAMARKAVEGWFTDFVLIDSRVSIFSRFGGWLDRGCEATVLVVLILLLGGRFVRKRRYEGQQNVRKYKQK